MALNFDNLISESGNVSLEDLSIESLVETALDPTTGQFNDIFDDNLSALNNDNNGNRDDMPDNCLFDIDVDKVWLSDCDINDSFQFGDLNLSDLDHNHSNITADNDDIYVNDNIFVSDHESSNIFKKNAKKNTRRQSTRIQNQTRKKIAEHIQRENVRLAMEAQFLNGQGYTKKKNNKTILINGKPASPTMQRYMSMPTDLDAEEDDVLTENVEVTSDDDPNKLWCVCRQPYGDRFMICCDNCLEWYHGDCVGVTQKEGSDMDEFLCPLCVINPLTDTVPKRTEEIVVIDDDDDQELLSLDDEDCLITKSVEPMKFNSNIFQLIKKTQRSVTEKVPLEPETEPAQEPETTMINLSALSRRTSVCLNPGCKTLVNPKKSLYCTKNCIDKYTRMVIKNNLREKSKQYGLPKGPKLAKMTRFVLAQPATETIQDEFATPTEEHLKEFLLKNPTYKVYQSAKPVKTKQDQEKSKKFLELLNKDPSKHIKVVKHFATLFKKSMPLKTFNTEFRNIWQHCVKMEEAVLENCDKQINDRYMLKVKELSEYLKKEENNKLCWDILHDKVLVADLLSMSRDQLDARARVIVLDDQSSLSADKANVAKKPFVANKGGISLLSDTTHLHGRHLYDINCKICNGASKSSAETKIKDKEPPPLLDNLISSYTDLSNEEKVPSPTNNDEYNVTSSVATPDMVVDMEISSTPSDKDDTESTAINTGITVIINADSSSVDIDKTTEIMSIIKPQKRKLISLWEGNVTYKDVGSMICKSYLVTRHFLNKTNEHQSVPISGDNIRDELDIGSSLDSEILVNGRSQLSVVQDYLKKLRKRSNKEFIVLRLHPTNLEDGGQVYLSMFEFFHSRERCGVISHKKQGVKDCFIYPLNAHAKIPSIFLPFSGPGFEKRRPHLLLLLIVRTPLSERLYEPISPKYDNDHDIVNKHGINLEKYYQPNQNTPFCPSPITTPSNIVSPVVKAKLVVTKVEINETETAKLDQCENKNPKLEQSEITKTTAENYEKNVVSETDVSAIPSIPSTKESGDICNAQKPIEDIITLTEEPKSIPNNTPDTSLCPQAFVYRCAPKPCVQNLPQTTDTKLPVNNDQCLMSNVYTAAIIDTKQQTTMDNSNNNNPTATRIIADNSATASSSFCQDLDLRLPAPCLLLPSADDTEQLIKVNSQNLFLKRKHSTRLYTYYDSFELDDKCQEKREKYFFNPHQETVAQLLVVGTNQQQQQPLTTQTIHNTTNCATDGKPRQRNISVFTPYQE